MKPHPAGQPNMVHFIQFLFPDGRRSDQWIERPKEIFDKAVALWAAGFSLEIENKDNTIWMSCVHHIDELAVDEICMNGPEVLKKIDRMIKEAHHRYIVRGSKV